MSRPKYDPSKDPSTASLFEVSDKSSMQDLLISRIELLESQLIRFRLLQDKVVNLPDGLSFDVKPEYGPASVIGYTLQIRM